MGLVTGGIFIVLGVFVLCVATLAYSGLNMR